MLPVVEISEKSKHFMIRQIKVPDPVLPFANFVALAKLFSLFPDLYNGHTDNDLLGNYSG